MLCCGLGALVIAVATLSWTHVRAAARRQPFARAAVVVTMALALLGLSVLVARHGVHDVARASASERTLLAEILSQPICTGTAAAAAGTPTMTAPLRGISARARATR